MTGAAAVACVATRSGVRANPAIHALIWEAVVVDHIACRTAPLIGARALKTAHRIRATTAVKARTPKALVNIVLTMLAVEASWAHTRVRTDAIDAQPPVVASCGKAIIAVHDNIASGTLIPGTGAVTTPIPVVAYSAVRASLLAANPTHSRVTHPRHAITVSGTVASVL